MGTYTTNYNLFMPTVGESGWGTLVNGNFSTIDTTMAGLNTRIDALEPLSVIQVDENQNVTFPGNVTVSGDIYGTVSSTEESVITVTPSSNTFIIETSTSTDINDLRVEILPLIPFTLYSGTVKLAAGATTQIINEDNTLTRKYYSSGSTITVSRVRMVSMYKQEHPEHSSWYYIPIFSKS